MIVTVTPNPSLDRTLEVTALVRDAVLRATGRRVEPGGKGINVARALHRAGLLVRAIVPSGGHEGRHLVALLAEEGIAPVTIPLREPVRANITVVEPDGAVTKINEPGPTLHAEEVEALLASVAREAAGARWVVASGSLPPGCPAGLFASIVGRAHEAGARVAIDSSGTALVEALRAGPDLAKPNLEELRELTGRPVKTLGEAIDAAAELVAGGVGTVLVSLGADGALLVDGDGPPLHAHLEVTEPRSTVGAGDATLAGYLVAADARREGRLRIAVAHGAAAVALPGTQMPGPNDLRHDRVELTRDPDRARPLSTAGTDLRGVEPRAGETPTSDDAGTQERALEGSRRGSTT